ncbi:P-type conjugative transfer protein TrbJ [Rhodospirillum sp. A1_3_36]|uniref:P-type conjugative transfer protein TrbJ n=1 Tax=Rhodospirillum sp. A1_3_36 TaxID=3391666 RepID=UPI0039A45E43
MRLPLLAVLVAAPLFLSEPAPTEAAWPVFDATNYTQNLLQAARAVEQITNQVKQIQNQVTMLQNMARNLQSLDFSSLGQIQGALTRIDGLMTQAQGLSFDLDQLDSQWSAQYPDGYGTDATTLEMAEAARARWQSAMGAYQRTMRVQSQIVANVRADEGLLADLVNHSQGATGALQAQQAANQLIALSAKQQMQIQSLLAAQGRAQAEDTARKAQAEEAARETTRRFLGSGTAYSGQ